MPLSVLRVSSGIEPEGEESPGFAGTKLMIENIIQKVSRNVVRMFLMFFMVL